jgi:DNA-binding beta-propeller fold protein YncE
VPGVGTQFASYRIEGVLGRGGMGVVYRATELGLERPVALKLIAPELAGDTAFRESFLRESRLAASIDHPGILPVYAAGEAEGELYLANRFVDGQDLRTVIAGGPLPPERALSIVGQVADALDAAHARGLVHRDVKPANVLVDGAGHCYLADFGLTTQLAAGQTATGPGPLAGSLDYLAPEQVRGGELDGRTDQYALAGVLYELLAGAPAFRRPTEAQTLWAHVQEDVPALQAYPELEPVLARALAKEQRERYETCNAFVDDARAALGLSLSPVAVRRRRRRMGRRLVAAGGAILAIATAAVLALTLGAGGTTVAPADSVGVVDASSGELERAVPVGSAPTEVAASDDWVWVLNSNDGAGTISKLDTRTRTVESTFSVPGTPRNLVAAFGSLWVGTVEGRVLRVDPETDLVEHRWTLPNAGVSSAFEEDRGAGWLAVSPGAVWAGSARALSRIDPETSRLRRQSTAAWGPMAYGFGSLWIAGRSLERISAVTMRHVSTVKGVEFNPDVAAGLGSVWLADDTRHEIVRVDPARGVVARRYELGGAPFGVAVGAGAAWAASDDGTVARIDPLGERVEVIDIGGAPRSLDVADRSVWVSVD